MASGGVLEGDTKSSDHGEGGVKCTLGGEKVRWASVGVLGDGGPCEKGTRRGRGNGRSGGIGHGVGGGRGQ